MKTRITLSIDPETGERAKRLARERNTTVSGLFSDFVQAQAPGQISPEEFWGQWSGAFVVRERPGDVRYERMKEKFRY